VQTKLKEKINADLIIHRKRKTGQACLIQVHPNSYPYTIV